MNNDENKDFIIINENGENVTPEDNLKKHEDESHTTMIIYTK